MRRLEQLAVMSTARKAALCALAVPMLVLAGCASASDGDGDESPTSASPAGESTGESELVQVTAGVAAIADTAPIWLGREEGFFEDQGIDLELEVIAGGTAGVPGVVSGQFAFSFSNTLSILIANEQGLDLPFLTAGAASTGDTAGDVGAVVVPGDSVIQSARDLAGRTVSVNALNNIGDTTIRAAIEADGGDPNDVDFLEIGFPDTVAAITGGQVEAAWTVTPFIEAAVANGARVVSWNYLEVSPELDIAGFFTSRELVDSDPRLVEAITAALTTSLEFAQANPDRVREIVGTYTEIPTETLETMVLPRFRTDFDRESLATLADYAIRFGALQGEPDFDAILPR